MQRAHTVEIHSPTTVANARAGYIALGIEQGNNATTNRKGVIQHFPGKAFPQKTGFSDKRTVRRVGQRVQKRFWAELFKHLGKYRQVYAFMLKRK